MWVFVFQFLIGVMLNITFVVLATFMVEIFGVSEGFG